MTLEMVFGAGIHSHCAGLNYIARKKHIAEKKKEDPRKQDERLG